MKKQKQVLAFDFGASSGRAMLGRFDGETIQLEEIHRFANDPVSVGGVLYWDVLRLFFEIKQGIIKAKNAGGFDSIGIDTWGLDFGLLDEDGRLLENPVHYRDSRTHGMLEEALSLVPKETLYSITGTQFMEMNTLFQLLSLQKKRPALLRRAKHLLMIPDLFNFFLTGRISTEYSIASTTQLLDAAEKTWSSSLLQRLGLPRSLFSAIVPSGTTLGPLSDSLCQELGVPAVPVIAVAGHDTQSAIVSVPAQEPDFAFLSCGTWSLLGTELAQPLISPASFARNLTNEGGYGYTASFLKNITGLWLLQESRRQWAREGESLSFGQLEELAEAAPPLQCFLDPDAPEFVPEGDIPARIQAFCKKTGQPVPETKGQIVRCINESLALKYRHSLEEISACTNRDYSTLYLVGGGVKSRLLCQLTADCCDRTVVAGPAEATVLGNIAVQLIAAGAIENLQAARGILSRLPEIRTYSPTLQAGWDRAYQTFQEVLVC